jgi:multidrug transporter EmrE-like cation transporter
MIKARSKGTMSPVAFLLMAVALGVAGQMVMKSGMSQVGALNALNVGALVKMFTNLRVILGIGCYAFSSIAYLMALSKLPLSLAYPMVGLGYVIVVLLSWLFLKEPVSLARWIGVLLICGGAVLIGR